MTNESPSWEVLAALGGTTSAELLVAVAAGLKGVEVDPLAEWSGLPSQHAAPPQAAMPTLPQRPSFT
ncbi:hypothetical protein [Pengzhenrongella frigida]|uniref:Uncharacterized protein n=1 Tax=Pengzhenrongella frigida TaxID=1259133 RepID=A0A4Q5N538_9MICO|nr:hypothetical protein [Cellulomonas sp. HLT2-17]RYV51867.1 hypothetical protein EUA98_06420 [Cellulomonas sp. HLT2-17]